MHGEKIHEDRGIDRRYPNQKGPGETNRAIGESYGLSLKQGQGLISRQNRK